MGTKLLEKLFTDLKLWTTVFLNYVVVQFNMKWGSFSEQTEVYAYGTFRQNGKEKTHIYIQTQKETKTKITKKNRKTNNKK